MSRWDSVAPTAHYTAQIWVRDHLPWAHVFDTPLGRAMYSATLPAFELASRAGFTTPMAFCVQRHRVIDALIDALRPAQVVELGGGLSPRCLALAHKLGIPAVDVDLPAMVRAKAERIGDLGPDGYRLVAMDLLETPDYVAGLGASLRALSPTVVVTEGVLSYFDDAQRRRVFEQVAGLLRRCGGGVYLTDVHHEEAVMRLGPVAALFRRALHRVSGTPQQAFIHDFAAGKAMLLQAGFDAVRGHLPVEYRDALALPTRNLDSGLTIYEATVNEA